MKVSVLTDEISQDPDTAIELAAEWGIKHVEIRSLFGKRVPDDDLAGRKPLIETLESHSMDVAAITPGLFKVPLSDSRAMEQHLNDRLPKSIEFAKAMQTNVVIAFTPILKGQPDPSQVEHYGKVLARAIDAVEREGLTLAIENEPICLVATGYQASRFVREFGSRSLRVNWDPGNAYFAGEKALEGYSQARDLVVHVHLKDCVTDQPTGAKRYVPIGRGEVGLEEQIRLLKEDRYGGYLTIETHFAPKVKGTRECLEGLKAILSRAGEGLE